MGGGEERESGGILKSPSTEADYHPHCLCGISFVISAFFDSRIGKHKRTHKRKKKINFSISTVDVEPLGRGNDALNRFAFAASIRVRPFDEKQKISFP